MTQLNPGDLVTVIPFGSMIGVNNRRRVYEKYPLPDGWDPPKWVEPNAIGIVIESRNSHRKVAFGDRVVWIYEHDIEVHK